MMMINTHLNTNYKYKQILDDNLVSFARFINLSHSQISRKQFYKINNKISLCQMNHKFFHFSHILYVDVWIGYYDENKEKKTKRQKENSNEEQSDIERYKYTHAHTSMVIWFTNKKNDY